MNFSNNDFLFKELVNTFAYTTATQNRDVCTDVSINGRRYTKYGTLQAVTFVGKLYKVGTPSEGYWPRENGRPEVKHNEKFVLFIGMSKQHPCDNKINKQLGYEIAETNALNNPQMIIEVQRGFNYRRGLGKQEIHRLGSLALRQDHLYPSLKQSTRKLLDSCLVELAIYDFFHLILISRCKINKKNEENG